MEAPNHYELLCVDPGATAEQIRVAYRRLIRVYHPDVATEAGEAMTLRLNAAQRELLDPTLRARYDRTLGGFSSEPTRSYRAPEPDRRPQPQPTYSRSYSDWSRTNRTNQPPQAAPEAAFSSTRFTIWLGLAIAAIAVVLATTAMVFIICYSGEITVFSARMIPPIVVGLTWLVGVIRRPPKLLIALMVIGAGLWPLAAFGVDPFIQLDSLPSPTLPALTVLVIAVILFRTAAPKAVDESHLRPRARRPRVA
jgi:hypothetical protein